MKKRILSVFLTLVMVLCLAPMTTFAEGESETATVTVDSVRALIDALPDASSIGSNDVAGVLTKLKAIDDAAPRLSNDDYNKLDDKRYRDAIAQLKNLAVEVKNESELKQQIAKGGSIKLSDGITLTEDLTVSSGVFLDGASFNGDYGIIIETNAFLCECNSSNITITNNGGTVWGGSYKSVINQNGGVVYQASASDRIKNNGGTVNGGCSKSVISEGGVLFQVRATDGDIIMKGAGTVSYSVTEKGDILNAGGTMNDVTADAGGSVENKPGGGSKIAIIKKVTAANLYNDKGGTIEDCTVVSSIDNDGGTIKKGNFEKASKVENKDNGVISGSTFGMNCQVYNSGTISDSTFNGKVNYTGIFTNCIFSVTSAVTNEQGGTIGEGTFAGTVTNSGTISGGTYESTGTVTNNGTIVGGTFKGSVTNNGTISGGTFTSTVNNNGLIYATANVADAGSITYDKTAGKVITYKIDENKYAEQFVKTYSTATKPAIDPTPTQTDYVFGGWYTESECSNAFDFENTSITKDITLYALWKENTVPVTPDTESNETPAVTITDEKLTMSETAVEIKSPKTSDSRMFLWLAFLLSSGSTVTIATLACKRRKY